MEVVVCQTVSSTNTLLKMCFRAKHIQAPLCIRAINQVQGRGQRSSTWSVDSGKNLTFSFLIEKKVSQSFVINMLVSKAIYNFLTTLKVPMLKIKWPNDILSGSKKIGGVLIEHLLSSSSKTSHWVIGIGLNVNQTSFNTLPKANSLARVCGHSFNLETLLSDFLKHLEYTINAYTATDYSQLLKSYESFLFRRGKVSTFSKEHQTFLGIIKGINSQGKLTVLLENDSLQEFDLKEIKLLY